MIARTSAVKIDAESGNHKDITVFNGETAAQAIKYASRELSA